MVRLRGGVHRRLEDIRGEVRRLRETLHVLDEQVAYVRQVADDATTRANVAGTPLADRERRAAVEDVHRTERQRDEVAGRLQRLHGEQDELLERLLPDDGSA